MYSMNRFDYKSCIEDYDGYHNIIASTITFQLSVDLTVMIL